MNRSDTEIYAETGKKAAPKRLTQGNYPDKKTNIGARICKHVTPDGWCSKKHQHCPLLNRSFINL